MFICRRISKIFPLSQPRSNYSGLYYTIKGWFGCRFSFQPSSSTPDLTHFSTDVSLQKVDWSNRVLLTGWNKNLQPHGPLWNSLDMTALSCQLFVFVHSGLLAVVFSVFEVFSFPLETTRMYASCQSQRQYQLFCLWIWWLKMEVFLKIDFQFGIKIETPPLQDDDTKSLHTHVRNVYICIYNNNI